MRSEEELRDELERAAEAIAEFSSNPRTWLSWITFLMERLEKKSMASNPMYRDLFDDLLDALQDAIRQRQRRGGW